MKPTWAMLSRVLSLFILSFPLLLHAQQNGTVTGVVLDPTGQPIQGAVVTLVNQSTGYRQQQVTTADGEYTFLQVKPAAGYVLTVEANNFKPNPSEAFELHVNQLYLMRPPIELLPMQAEVKEAEVAKPTPQTTAEAQVAAKKLPPPNAERPTVSPDFSPILSGVVDSDYVHTLPLADRDFITLALLVPGTYPLPQGSSLQGASLVVNGVRGNMNNFLLDGADNNDYTVNQSLPFQIVEAMKEFRVQTSTSTADFGRAAGGQINVVTQSGSNKLHGELFEFNRNSALSADNPLSAYAGGTFDQFAQYSRVNTALFGTPNSGGSGNFPAPVLSDPLLNNIYQNGRYFPLNQNQFGANLGGPIKKDKLFFFFNWESFRAADGRPVFDRVPDINSRSQSTCPFLGGCNSKVMALFNLYPVPNIPASTVVNSHGYPVSNPVSADTTGAAGAFFAGDAPNNSLSNNYLGRIDWNASSKSVLSFKYNIQTFNQLQADDIPQTANYPGNGITLDGQNNNFSVNFVHTFNSSTVNKLTFGWNRFSFNTLPLDSTINASQYFQNLNFSNEGLPSIITGGYYSFGGYSDLGAFNAPYTRTDSVWSITNNFSKIRGRHTLEFGGNYNYNRLDVDNQAAARGLVTLFDVPYALQFGNIDFASIARIAPQFGGNANGTGSFARTFTDNAMGLYVQDTWRPRQNISLYYGLRWDVYQAPVEAKNLLVNDYPGACNDPNGTQLVCLIQAGSNKIYNSDGTPLGTASFTAPRAGFGTDWHNFGPHIGISWSPGNSGETVFRGGFAIAYDQQSLEPSVDMLLNPPFVQQSDSFTVAFTNNNTYYPLTLPATFAPGFLPSTGTTYNGAFWFPEPYSITARDRNTRTPYAYQYHFGIEQQLGNNNVLGISYVGSLGHRLPDDILLLDCDSGAFAGSTAAQTP